MNSKKLFLLLVIIFFGVMLYISYDMSTRTTFPGAKPQLKERLFNGDEKQNADTVDADSVRE